MKCNWEIFSNFGGHKDFEMKKVFFLFACIFALIACNEKYDNRVPQDTLEVYDAGKDYLRRAGVSTDGLLGFVLSAAYTDISVDEPFLCAHTVSCTDGTKEHIFILTFDSRQGPEEKLTLLHQLTVDMPSAPYTVEDKGYGEKEYKIYRYSAIGKIKIYGGNLYGVVVDVHIITNKEPSSGTNEDGSITFSTAYRTEYDNPRILISSKQYGDKFIPGDATEWIPTDSGIIAGNLFYGLDGNKKYEVSENTHWGKCVFYYDEYGYKNYSLTQGLSEFWLLNYKDSQFLGAEMGLWYNPTKATFTNAYGPFVIKICIEDLKEGAYGWRSMNITSLEDNNRYESLNYSGRSGNVYKWQLSGTAYSGDKFTYTISADAEKQTIVVTDQNSQTISIHNEFSCGYTKHR